MDIVTGVYCVCVLCQAVSFYVVRYQIKKEREFLFSMFEGWIRMSSLFFYVKLKTFHGPKQNLIYFFLFSDRKIKTNGRDMTEKRSKNFSDITS